MPTVHRSCWVDIAPSAPGQRVVVPFPETCGLASVVVQLPDVNRTLNLTVEQLNAWPDDVPLPKMGTAPAMIFRAELLDANGTAVQPGHVQLQVRLPGEWLANCPSAACHPKLFHYHDGAWSQVALDTVDWNDAGAVLQGETDGFSVFAVAGESASSAAWSVVTVARWAIIPIALVLAVATALSVSRRHRSELAEIKRVENDRKVDELLGEATKGKEELLQFVNNAAHDLANPLTPIQMQLDLLAMAAQRKDDAKHQKSLDVVRRNIEQLTMLVQDLRDASKLQAGKLRLSKEVIDVTALVRDTVESYTEQAARLNLNLATDAEDALVAEADAGRVVQVITNFLNNALKFTPAGGTVTLSAVREGQTVRVGVTDTGLGLTKEDQERLFRPFSQVHGEEQKKKGTGLGLFIAKGIIEGHGGTIGCTSAGPGTGSTFWFTLPWSDLPLPPPAPTEDGFGDPMTG